VRDFFFSRVFQSRVRWELPVVKFSLKGERRKNGNDKGGIRKREGYGRPRILYGCLLDIIRVPAGVRRRLFLPLSRGGGGMI